MCDAEVVGKCGSIVAHHWAHVARPDCDTWATESRWHIAWKQYLHEHLAAAIEVPMERHGARHRADAVIGRLIVELQATYLPPSDIDEREAFYGRMAWIYDGTLFADRIQWGSAGFWIKHGPKSLLRHRRPVFVASPSGRRFLRIVNLNLVNGRLLGRGHRLDVEEFLEQIDVLARPAPAAS